MSKMPVFTEPGAVSEQTLAHQVALLRWVNQGLQQEIIELSANNQVLRARISILLSMLCDAGVRLPDDLQ